MSDTRWVLVLNKYQRDNLVYLLHSIGYPAATHSHNERMAPETAVGNFNTGDWVGEIYWMVASSLGTPCYASMGTNRSGEQLPGPINPNVVST